MSIPLRDFPEDADTEAFAQRLDDEDPLHSFRDKFIIPSKANLRSAKLAKPGLSNEPGIYLCGNSLGVQPKAVSRYVEAQLDTWSSIGVYGHFVSVEDSPLTPWQSLAESAAKQSARLVGANPGEVAIMESQIQLHGYDSKDAMVLLEPDLDHTITTKRVCEAIEKHADELALVLLPGIQYYSGQYFDISKITKHAHSKGLIIGWDLAHAAGNVPVRLHDWDVDFAAWCTYKYMNAGPGSIAGLFVHEKHTKIDNTCAGETKGYRHRLTGWYGGDKDSRFRMDNNFKPIPGAGGFQLSNPSAIDLASLCGSLSVFDETSITELRHKSLQLTAYLQHLLLKDTSNDKPESSFRIITPLDPEQRGAQLSILLKPGLLDQVSRALQDAGIVADKREPGVVRVAPTPLYNTYHDVWVFVQKFKEALGI
ncbi:putative l-kynurenine hydrolase [Phaeomoniella chlamydospora]|uniref:Kynureninase n=1 Tax=Phaeomoniella chlamydospora TaxID=158046 RepID=A0A0G2HAA5_PHACM|nr:putative l-kynurenine hydrolase [Phaeomoniella chlamydospora]